VRTLHGRFFLIVAALVFGNGALAFLLQARTFHAYELAMTQALNSGVAAALARELAASSAPLDRTSALRAEFKRLMAINPASEIYLLDGAGRVLVSSASASQLRRPLVDLQPLVAFIGGRSALPVTADDPRDASAQQIFSAATVDAAGDAGGYVYVVLGGAETRAAAGRIQSGLLLRTTVMVIGLGLAVALLTALVVMTTLTRKLRRLTGVIEQFRLGQFREPRPVPTTPPPAGDELDRLGRAYNEMIEHIGRQMDQIARSQVTRQELITNVSHDLRAPLASLRGYLETLLLKESVLPADERRTYVEVAVRQAGYMDRLISELFALATLEELDRPLNAEPFQISELVQDVVQKFEPIASDKGITLRGLFLPNAPMLYGDIALIERLLDNLLDNALRHTPSGGYVEVKVTVSHQNVVLDVSDTGTGIRRGQLDKIFKRPHRGDTGRTGAGGAGLGLAIVKRIVELHRATISVRSDEGIGTSFRVEFPGPA